MRKPFALVLVLALAMLSSSAFAGQKPSAAKPAPAQATTAATEQQADTEQQPQLTQPDAVSGPALPAGTQVKMKLEQQISTITNKAGDTFSGRVTEDVFLNGKAVIPVGSTIQGHVVRVSAERRYKGRPSMDLHPEIVTLPNGDKFNFIADVTKTDAGGTHVNSEGRVIGSGIDKSDKIQMAVGAGGGALVGGLAAQSASGTFIGAAVGGGAAVIYWLTKHKSATLPPGTEIVMELARPMTVTQASD